ncbi:MAG TPA: UDP-2,3-diacylglucosamine diphosphatase [Burkholderiales bacterium]|nr:UDP-2,3-diacylglucosamine diphosphatase [Burkholderiales bacterium]
MDTVKPVLFVSDLHLAAARPQIHQTFLRFLQEEAREAAALYILGDLVEYWVGDEDADEEFNRGIIAAIAALSQSGVPVYLMHGNRDFLIGRKAAKRAGLQLLADPTVIDLFGQRTLLMHGDTLCTDDLAYMKARARWRRPLILRAFLAMPLALRRRIGGKLRATSERTKRDTPAALMDVNQQEVERVLRANAYPRLIHGHTHRPARHLHQLDGNQCERWVLGDWYQSGSYLRCDAQGCRSVALLNQAAL